MRGSGFLGFDVLAVTGLVWPLRGDARDDDDVDRLDKKLKDKVVERLQREYDHTVDDGSRVFDDLGHLESES
jgi:hypothetical protein